MLDSKENVLSEHGSSTMISGSQNHLKSLTNEQLPDPRNSVSNFTSPNSRRNDVESSTDANVAHNRIPSKNTRSSLQCSRCCKLRRSCLGEPGVSCKYCTRNRARCSFLDPRPFRCEPCNRDYATDAALRGHNTRSHPRDLDVPEVPHIPSSPPSSISQIPTSSLQQHEKSKTSIDHILNISCDPTNRPSGEAGSQRRCSPESIPPSSRIPTIQQHPSTRGSWPGATRLNQFNSSPGEPQYGVGHQNRRQSLRLGETPIPKRYQDLHFEKFNTDEKRNMSDGHVQEALDGIRDEIDQYADFIRGKDKDTPIDVRERLRFLDEVTPLIHLREIDEETSEILGLLNSRLVMALRSMFAVPDNTRLEEEFENLAPAVRLLKLPHLVCGVLAYLLLQLFTKKDPIRELELRATELTHGVTHAANTIQHSRLFAQESHIFQARLENYAKKLAPSFYDMLRPLTCWQQDGPRNGSEEQHIEKLKKIIFASLRFAAELEARKGTFSFFWPRSGAHFDPNLHNDEADDSTLEGNKNKGRSRNKQIAFTLMPGVVGTMDNKELPYAKATVITTQPNEHDGF